MVMLEASACWLREAILAEGQPLTTETCNKYAGRCVNLLNVLEYIVSHESLSCIPDQYIEPKNISESPRTASATELSENCLTIIRECAHMLGPDALCSGEI